MREDLNRSGLWGWALYGLGLSCSLQGPPMCARGPYIEVEMLRRLGMKVNAHVAHSVLEELPLDPDEARNAATVLGAQRLFGSV